MGVEILGPRLVTGQ